MTQLIYPNQWNNFPLKNGRPLELVAHNSKIGGVTGWLVTASHLKYGSVPGRKLTGAFLLVLTIAAGFARPLTPLWMLIIPGVMLLLGRATPKLTDEKSGRKLR